MSLVAIVTVCLVALLIAQEAEDFQNIRSS